MVYKRHCRLNQTRLRSDLQEHSTHGKVMPLPGQIKEDDDDEDETASFTQLPQAGQENTGWPCH